MEWIMMESSNKSMNRFIGKKMSLFTPTRREDGHKVLFTCEPGNRNNWYFYTSTIISVTCEIDYESGIESIEFRTRNSVYKFYRNI